MNYLLAVIASHIQAHNNVLRSELATLKLIQAQNNQEKKCLKADERVPAKAYQRSYILCDPRRVLSQSKRRNSIVGRSYEV